MAELLYSSEQELDRGNGDNLFIFTRLNLAADENFTKSDLNDRVQLIIFLIKNVLEYWLSDCFIQQLTPTEFLIAFHGVSFGFPCMVHG